MTLKSVHITNVKGIAEIELRVGVMNQLCGGNGVGKSSVLDAITSIFSGGHEPSLIRLGEKKAEVVLMLDDGTKISKTITEKSSKLEIIPPGGGVPIPAPKAFVDSLASGFGVNPLGLITASRKDRVAFLLECMPIAFEPAELSTVGIKATEPLTLDGLTEARDRVYKSRTDLNRKIRDAEGTVASLQEGLLGGDDTDWTKAYRDLEAETMEVEAQIKSAEEEAFKAALEEERTVATELDEAIAALVRQRSERIDGVRTARGERLKQIAEVANPERERLARERGAAWERSQTQMKAAGARQTIESMRQKIRDNFIESEGLAKTLSGLDEMRRKKLDALPVDGVEIRNGEIFINGVAFEQVNLAERFILSIRLAKLKKPVLMVVDQAECLDEEMWPAFVQAVRESGTTVFAARVSDGPLKVIAQGPL